MLLQYNTSNSHNLGKTTHANNNMCGKITMFPLVDVLSKRSNDGSSIHRLGQIVQPRFLDSLFNYSLLLILVLVLFTLLFTPYSFN
jgi:hypothetical protein